MSSVKAALSPPTEPPLTNTSLSTVFALPEPAIAAPLRAALPTLVVASNEKRPPRSLDASSTVHVTRTSRPLMSKRPSVCGKHPSGPWARCIVMAMFMPDRTASSESLRTSSGGRLRNSVVANVSSATTTTDPNDRNTSVIGRMLPASWCRAVERRRTKRRGEEIGLIGQLSGVETMTHDTASSGASLIATPGVSSGLWTTFDGSMGCPPTSQSPRTKL